MNKERRAEITKLESQLEQLKATAAGIKDSIDSIKDDEQEAFDNLSESLQGGDKGQAMEAAVSNLESANEQIEDIESSVEEAARYLAAAREGE